MKHHRLRNQVINCLERSWKRDLQKGDQVINFLISIYDRFRTEGLADDHFEIELTSGDPNTYTQRMSELLLAEMLWSDGFNLSSNAKGPDFKATKAGRSAWIELVTPAQSAELAGLLTPVPGGTLLRSFPHEEINLRWTSAISEKSQKLMGDALGKKKGYIADGIVDPNDIFIIAVNSRLLERSPSGGLYGVSQFPAPVEVLFGIGPIEVVLSRETGDIEDQRNQHRPVLIKKKTGAAIPSNTFLDPHYSQISSVLGLSLIEATSLGYGHFSELVHNPQALNPTPPGWFTGTREWMCDLEVDHYSVYPVP
ncbi:hypothetical protein [Metapseudomonas otitidis]|uniref:hypothetical protein n=1 Tax=Metapseudomonas otitidis TaxID=319939 RepID=UPI0013F6081D|nr:hypothetical protein [Pseudomonas otitidis]